MNCWSARTLKHTHKHKRAHTAHISLEWGKFKTQPRKVKKQQKLDDILRKIGIAQQLKKGVVVKLEAAAEADPSLPPTAEPIVTPTAPPAAESIVPPTAEPSDAPGTATDANEKPGTGTTNKRNGTGPESQQKKPRVSRLV